MGKNKDSRGTSLACTVETLERINNVSQVRSFGVAWYGIMSLRSPYASSHMKIQYFITLATLQIFRARREYLDPLDLLSLGCGAAYPFHRVYLNI
jgi:hypothetical protein